MNKKIVTIVAITLAVMSGMILTPSAKTFPDVSTTHTFYVYINALSDEGIVGGYSDNTFRPEENVTRGQMAKFVVNGLGITKNVNCEKFTDVGADNKFDEYITTLKCEGISKGYAGNEYHPADTITRGEAMSLIVRGMRKIEGAGYLEITKENKFVDIKEGDTHYESIMAAYSNDIVSGSGDHFYPHDVTSRGALSKMVYNSRVRLGISNPVSPNPTPGSTSEYINSVIQSYAADDPYLGDVNAARVVMIEFKDLECPFCQRHALNVYPQIKSEYIDTGKLIYVSMELPTKLYEYSQEKAIAAECAYNQLGSEKYFDFIKVLFLNETEHGKNSYMEYINDLGGNGEELSQCMDDGNSLDKVNEDVSVGESFGVTGTPAFFIFGIAEKSNQQYSSSIIGSYDFEVYQEVVDYAYNN